MHTQMFDIVQTTWWLTVKKGRNVTGTTDSEIMGRGREGQDGESQWVREKGAKRKDSKRNRRMRGKEN